MNNNFTLTIDFGTPAFDEILKLRDDILRQPLGLKFEVEDITKEYNDIHLACYGQGMNLKGCLLLSARKNGQVQMRQVAVRKDCQRKGIGAQLVVDSEQVARHHGFTKMILNARDTAVSFYESLGYKKTGNSFIEVGIKHFRMEKALS